MTEQRVDQGAGGTILFDAARAPQVDADWFSPHRWRERGALRSQPGGRGGVAIIETPAGEAVLRHYRRGGMHLAVEPLTSQMEEKVSQALGHRVRFRFVADRGNLGTPAERRAQAASDAQANAEASMEADPLVQTLKREFDARVIPQSIKPVEPGT